MIIRVNLFMDRLYGTETCRRIKTGLSDTIRAIGRLRERSERFLMRWINCFFPMDGFGTLLSSSFLTVTSSMSSVLTDGLWTIDIKRLDKAKWDESWTQIGKIKVNCFVSGSAAALWQIAVDGPWSSDRTDVITFIVFGITRGIDTNDFLASVGFMTSNDE